MGPLAHSVPPSGAAQPNHARQEGPANAIAPLAALCAIARFHQVAADPATLAHQLGLSPNQPLSAADLVHAARHLGLKAKLSRTTLTAWP
jgi:subfamily B ATP-binding cassette protein HlyB/CyaB